MSNTIRIKRRASGAAGAPASLANAELAFNEVDSVLYYGEGGTASAAASIIKIGGDGAYITLDTTQTVTGDKTLSGVVSLTGTATAVTQTANDNSTNIATTAYVDTAIGASGESLSFQADSGSVESITLANETLTIAGGTGLTTTNTTNTTTIDLDNTAVGAGSYGAADTVATFTVDAQGRLTAAADAQISILAAAVTDFDTQVQTNTLDSLAAPVGSVSLNTQNITNLLDPIAPQDAATKSYVDAVAVGLTFHDAVRATTDSALPSYTYNNGTGGIGATITATANGLLTVDGVPLNQFDRILVKDETGANAPYNGIYLVTQPGDPSTPFELTRVDDFDQDFEVPSAFVFVSEGTLYADTGFVCATDAGLTVGTTDIIFIQFSGTGHLIAGNGLIATGNLWEVLGTAGRISVGPSGVDIDATYAGQTSIDTLGTVTTGTWNASVIDVLYGGTGASNATDARTNLGLAIGTDVQAYDAELATLAGMASGTATALAALTQAEVEVIDGSTSATATTLASTDTFVVNDAGTMVQVALSDLVTFLEDETASGFNVDGGSF